LGDGHSSRIWITPYLKQLTRGKSGRLISLLFSLAPSGVYLASHVTVTAGGLLHHRFTLARKGTKPSVGGLLSVATIPWGRPHWVLPSTLPYGVRTFLICANKRDHLIYSSQVVKIANLMIYLILAP
jgi:hypothetical protein